MIPENFIQRWRQNVQWQTPTQVEQDLIISRALVDLYNEPHVREALVFPRWYSTQQIIFKATRKI